MVKLKSDVESEVWGAFVVLPENRSAREAVRSLDANPLMLHGPSGTGKTHLVSELLKELAARRDVFTARSVSAGDLARVEGALSDRDLAACDLLVLEDVQHLTPRDADTFCGLLDRRIARRKDTILTSSAAPADLRKLPRKVTSRLASGLVVQLEPLGPASRRVLLEHMAKVRKIRLEPSAIDWLAEQATGGGARPLLGLLETLSKTAPGGLGTLDAIAVQRLLLANGQPLASKRDVSRIVKQVAAAFRITEKELLGPSRLRRVLVPRQVAMYLARELSGLSLPRLGAAFGGRDHTTILHACRKVEADAAHNATLAGIIRQLRNELA